MVLGCWATLGYNYFGVLLVSNRRTSFSFSPVLFSCHAGLSGILTTPRSRALHPLLCQTPTNNNGEYVWGSRANNVSERVPCKQATKRRILDPHRPPINTTNTSGLNTIPIPYRTSPPGKPHPAPYVQSPCPVAEQKDAATRHKQPVPPAPSSPVRPQAARPPPSGLD